VKGRDVGQVLSFIDEARLVRLAQALVRIDTQNPPGNEASLAAFVAEYLGRLGLACEIQDVKPQRANLLARLGDVLTSSSTATRTPSPREGAGRVTPAEARSLTGGCMDAAPPT
jgi:hypothetical protein